MVSQSLLHKVLDRLECQEVQLLVWGDTGGMFTENEVLAQIEDVAPNEDPYEVLDTLVEEVMIYRVPDQGQGSSRYRTRMGEAVHLFRNLRQWFHGRPVVDSKPLVSDYRFLRRPRYYPVRNNDLTDLLDTLRDAGVDVDHYEEVLKLQISEYLLSGFQVRSTSRILQAYEQHRQQRLLSPSASIVCAGTGSGKTLAFYLPALSALADDLQKDFTSRVRLLAVYPRNELLKDQFNETWQQCRKLDGFLQHRVGRKLRIGAFYGDTPHAPQYVTGIRQGGYLPHWLSCPTPGCKGQMRWLKSDIDQNKERLRCSVCHIEVGSDTLALTRRSMVQDPPDIVFTTTEMLNNHLANPRWQKLFGIHPQHPCSLVLLDEVHTYTGSHGAHVAFLFRRWMRMANAGPHFVGLSATLADAETFFAQLTGTNRSRVQKIEARPSEMIEEGAEYLLALRGDPVAQTALLSTTIQSAMLMHRLLDPLMDAISKGTWGSKVFLFSDNLDVTNRLYGQLADAEGWRLNYGSLEEKPEGPLAALRNPSTNDRSQLQEYGQDWGIARELGYGLDINDRAMLERTSSQDKGVSPEAEMIVATASLEVGFNDPQVGAVIQHKAPRDVASYVQRKGRAGRPRAMRPWTVVVLSDFGRDRVVYQHYEQLLSPEIRIQRLPLGNSHIQRMQTAMAVLDWISIKVGKSIWGLFNRPRRKETRQMLLKIKDWVEKCLVEGQEQDELMAYVRNALQLDEDQVNRVFWQSPRAILLEFLPLIRQRIDTSWAAWNPKTRKVEAWVEANEHWGSPIPEHIPSNLFSDLNRPNLKIMLQRGEEALYEAMEFFQGLQEFAPGRISKRFAVTWAGGADWLVPTTFDPIRVEDGSELYFEVDDAFTSVRMALGTLEDPESGEELVISRPHFIRTSVKSLPAISESSNARLLWITKFRMPVQALGESPPKAALWARSLEEITFCLHRNQTQLEIVRVNKGVRAQLRFRGRREVKRLFFRWIDQGRPAAVGTRLWVDAMRCVFHVSRAEIVEGLSDVSLTGKLRAAFLQDGIRSMRRFQDAPFSADWVYECFIACVALEMKLKPRGLSNIIDEVLANASTVTLEKVPRLLFQSHLGAQEEEGALIDQLEELLADDGLLQGMRLLSKRLTDDLSTMPEALEWCQQVLAKTLAGAVHNGVCLLLPDVDEQAIIADAEVIGESIHVYLSEQESGGAGVITQLQEQYAEDPVGMLNTLAQTLRATEYEQLNEDIWALLHALENETELQASFQAVRMAESLEDRLRANQALNNQLFWAGFHLSHSFSAVLFSRVLRPGSSESSDRRLAEALDGWMDMEDRLGFELPLNIAALCQVVSGTHDLGDSGRIYSDTCRLQGVLWPRGMVVRQNALQNYNRFDNQQLRTERLLGEYFCAERTQEFIVNDTDWLSQVHALLRADGRVDVLIPRRKMHKLNPILAILQSESLEDMGLLFYPRVSAMYHRGSFLVLRTEFAEAIH